MLSEQPKTISFKVKLAPSKNDSLSFPSGKATITAPVTEAYDDTDPLAVIDESREIFLTNEEILKQTNTDFQKLLLTEGPQSFEDLLISQVENDGGVDELSDILESMQSAISVVYRVLRMTQKANGEVKLAIEPVQGTSRKGRGSVYPRIEVHTNSFGFLDEYVCLAGYDNAPEARIESQQYKINSDRVGDFLDFFKAIGCTAKSTSKGTVAATGHGVIMDVKVEGFDPSSLKENAFERWQELQQYARRVW